MKKEAMLHSVMSVFQSSPKEPFNYKQISKLIGVESQVQKLQVVDLLYDLSAENFITEIDRGRYRYNGLGTTAIGTFGRRSNGKNSFIPEDGGAPVFVAERNSGHAMDGDKVKVQLFAKRKGAEPEAEVIEVLESQKKTFVGKLQVTKGFAFLITENKTLANDIFIPKEKLKGGKEQLVITEIPYPMIGANIGKFLNDIAALVESKKAPEITDISNQSSKEGIRIVIELRKDADAENFVNLLYKKTRLEDTFGVNMLAICDGRPETMGLKAILKANVDFQFQIATRKYNNLLARELERKEVQEGLIKACNVIDLIIEILRGSKDRNMAKACLVEGKTAGIKFKSKESKIMAAQLSFTERQANAILEMRLYKLIGLEIEALIKEHEDTMANIYRYEDILDRRDSMAQVIINELDEFRKAYSRKRRTVIDNVEEAVYKEKEIEETEVVFLMDRFGYVKVIDTAAYERNKEAAEAESRFLFPCKNTGKVCLFTSAGQLHSIKVMDLPFGKFRDKGVPIDNVSNYNSEKEQIVCITSQTQLNLRQVVFVTAQSMIKLVSGGEFDVSKRTVAATKLAEGDQVLSVMPLEEQSQVILQTKEGFFLKFAIEEIPEQKKAALGARGMKLGPKDCVENVYYTSNAVECSIEYKGKAIDLNRMKTARRDGKGTKIRV